MSGKRLYKGTASTTAAGVYTSTNTTTQVVAATVTNKTALAATLTVWTVDGGGATTDAGALLIDEISVGTNETIGLDKVVGHMLESGEQIYLQAGTANALDVRISGVTGV